MLNFQKIWYQKSPLSFLLLPLSWLFGGIVIVRRALYQNGWKKVINLPVPVIVVGNITIGGTGKTPLVASIVKHLMANGMHPGIISRGYRGQSKQWPLLLNSQSSARLVGDEPLLLFHQCQCPVAVGPNRVETAKMLLEKAKCDVVVSDDGLQHYRLGRAVEIAVIDGARKLGNGRYLPAGPLREKPARLKSVDIIVVNDGEWPQAYNMTYTLTRAVNLVDKQNYRPLADFCDQTVHAVAGIGHPERFFNSLRQLGLTIIMHPFPDHHIFRRGDCEFEDDLAVLMTEKDAVKIFVGKSILCADFREIRRRSVSNHGEKNINVAALGLLLESF